MSVPAADEAVVAWMELQDNPSLSVRMLIRESIERQGYVDVVNRPVSQLPKHSRPAEGSEEAWAAEAAGADVRPLPASPAREAEFWPEAPMAVQRPHTPEPQAPVSQAPVSRTSVSPASAPRTTPDVSAAAPSEPEQSSSELQDVNDIFSRMR